MTQEEKQLLLKDLCARLPYGVIVQDRNGTHTLIPGNTELGTEYIKPYLRPMSSMTEKEEKDYILLSNHCIVTSIGFVRIEAQILIDWLNEHHFDYRGLIEKGLALEAPKDIYKTE